MSETDLLFYEVFVDGFCGCLRTYLVICVFYFFLALMERLGRGGGRLGIEF